MAGQTAYSATPAIGVPGMLADGGHDRRIDTMIVAAGQTIPFGAVVEDVGDGTCRLPGDTGNPGAFALCGVAVMSVAREQSFTPGVGSAGAAYTAGEAIPVLRRGRIFALWSGTTQVARATPNVTHSSTTNSKGYFTDAAAASTAGSEISAAVTTGGCSLVRPTGAAGFCLVDLNLP